METISKFDRWPEELHRELGRQALALKELSSIFADEARKLVQRDQVAILSALKARIMKEVEHVQQMETVAHSGFNKAKLPSSLLAFGAGALFASAEGREDPISTGAKAVKSVLDTSLPFGTILITVDKGGLPSDVRVTPVSRLARQSHINEFEVKAKLQDSGCISMTPTTFARLLSNVQSRVLDGSMSLPMPIEQLTKEMRDSA